MSSQFEPAYAYMQPNEGRWSDDPNDPGKATAFGISLRSLIALEREAYILKWDFDHDGDVDADDMKILSLGEHPGMVEAFYRVHFWQPRFEEIKRQAIATKLFDAAVNMGPSEATKTLQRALAWFRSDVMVDGGFGPNTLAQTNSVGETSFLERAFCAELARFYFTLLDARPSRAEYMRGWLRRAYKMPAA